MVRSHRLSAESTFVGQTCALCKQSFVVDDRIVICPDDGSRHHDHCWQANGNRCTAYGCTGRGEIGVSIVPSPRRSSDLPPQTITIPNPTAQQTGSASGRRSSSPAGQRSGGPTAPPGSKVRVFPARNFGCARSCLFLAVVLLVLLVGVACFGLYSLIDMAQREWMTSALPAAPAVGLVLSRFDLSGWS